MKTNILTTAAALSDQDLLARLDLLAARERGASVELVAHLAALDTRPSVFAAKGYSSLFKYCTEALKLSEDAACNRIAAARACRRFPVILDLLGSGDLTLTSVRMLGKHLTVENHEAASPGPAAGAVLRSRSWSRSSRLDRMSRLPYEGSPRPRPRPPRRHRPFQRRCRCPPNRPP